MQPRPLRPVLLVAALLATACTSASAQEIVATPRQANGVYPLGEKPAWSVEVRGEGSAAVTELRYVLKKGGSVRHSEGTIPLTDGKGALETSLDEPGTLLGELVAKLPEKEVKLPIGAAVEPQKIAVSAPRPDDFDAFWAAKLADLQAVPANPIVEPVESGDANVDYFKVRMDNIKGTHVYGQLARPKKEGKCPALLIVQWAGIYPLDRRWVTGPAAGGWLTLNIIAHDLPIDQPKAFYDNLNSTTLKGYTGVGNDDRETSYFLRMYLSCYRAAEYLAQRPDWDGQTLVVTGGSQGGLQTIVTAGLHPKVTGAMACVPAGCDNTASRANRAVGWPGWQRQTQGKDPAKVLETSRYFDAVNFASRAKCPTLVGMGLVDTTCPASGVFAMVNQLGGPKEVLVMPTADHRGPHGAYYERHNVWLKALAAGNAAPVR